MIYIVFYHRKGSGELLDGMRFSCLGEIFHFNSDHPELVQESMTVLSSGKMPHFVKGELATV